MSYLSVQCGMLEAMLDIRGAQVEARSITWEFNCHLLESLWVRLLNLHGLLLLPPHLQNEGELSIIFKILFYFYVQCLGLCGHTKDDEFYVQKGQCIQIFSQLCQTSSFFTLQMTTGNLISIIFFSLSYFRFGFVFFSLTILPLSQLLPLSLPHVLNQKLCM